jgi:hypothetical protein
MKTVSVSAKFEGRTSVAGIGKNLARYKRTSGSLKYLLHLKETDPAEYWRVKELVKNQEEPDEQDWEELGKGSGCWHRIKHGLVEEGGNA